MDNVNNEELFGKKKEKKNLDDLFENGVLGSMGEVNDHESIILDEKVPGKNNNGQEFSMPEQGDSLFDPNLPSERDRNKIIISP